MELWILTDAIICALENKYLHVYYKIDLRFVAYGVPKAQPRMEKQRVPFLVQTEDAEFDYLQSATCLQRSLYGCRLLL